MVKVKVETEDGGEVGGGGASGEGIDRGMMVVVGGVTMTVVAEEEVMGVAADRDRVGRAVVANERA